MTINLEKELIRQNRKLVMPEELLAIQEFERNAGLLQNDALERVGLTTQIKKGKEIKERLNSKRKETAGFKQERVFHISQIESLCKKYDLRFLPSVLFKGHLDANLATKIVNFEAAYSVTCRGGSEDYVNDSFTFPSFSFAFEAFKIPSYLFGGEEISREEQKKIERAREEAKELERKNRIPNTFIVAPAENFALQERPKDPLFFYEINDEYFYLIHKWGNDLNVFRRIAAWYKFDFGHVFSWDDFKRNWRSPIQAR